MSSRRIITKQPPKALRKTDANFVPTRSPGAPLKTVPTKPKNVDVMTPDVKPPIGGAAAPKPSFARNTGNTLLTVGALGGVSLLPTFLGGARNSPGAPSGGGGLLDGLLNTAGNLGTAAVLGDAAKTIGGDIVKGITGVLNNPVNLAIIAAGVAGVFVLTRSR